MVPLVGYLDRLSGRPGESIDVKVSSAAGAPYAADLVRIIHADPNPAGPGLKLAELASGFAGTYPSRVQTVHPGSYGVIDAALAVPEGGAIRVRVQPGLLADAQPVLGAWRFRAARGGERRPGGNRRTCRGKRRGADAGAVLV